MRKNEKRFIAILLSMVFVVLSGMVVFAGELPESENNITAQKEISTCVIGEIEAVVFNGKQHQPKVLVYDGEILLTEDTDYQLTYGENLHAGHGNVTATGLGKYKGTVTKFFAIEKAKIKIKGNNVTTTGKPKVTWKKVNGAAEYKVYYSKKKKGTYQYLTATTKLNYIHQSAERSKTYYYQIKAYDADGKTKDFEKSTIVEITCKLPSPKIKFTNILKTGKPKLSWTKIKGAEKYAIYRAPKKTGTYQYLTTIKSTSWIDQKAKAGVRYYYKAKAIDTDNRDADSVLSGAHLRSCDLRRPVISIDLTSKAKPKLTWKKVSAAEKYQVFRATKKNGTYRSIGKTKNLYYIDKNVKGGKSYYYRVRAIDEDNGSANSAKSLRQSIYVVDLNKKLLALTFDDGPGPYTKAIVNKLKKHNAKATFFVLGQRVKSYPDELKAIYKGGNEIGNHSYSHPILSYEKKSVIQSQMSRTDKAVKNVIGITPTIMRPPGGGIDATVKKNVGKPLIMWNIDTRDWEHRNTATTVNCVLREASDGDIVLMHDIHAPTKDAALKLIPKLKKKGFELVTVSQLAKFKGKKLKKGVVYYSF